jgi:uncharacterized protein (DUF1778 family)
MTESKGTTITIRISGEEKGLLAEEANNLGMSLSEYVRYKALEEDKVVESQQKTAEEFLDKYIAKMSRLIIDGWVHTKAMALNNLSKEQEEDAHQMSLSEFKKMGVTKWEEKYGEKTPRANKND